MYSSFTDCNVQVHHLIPGRNKPNVPATPPAAFPPIFETIAAFRHPSQTPSCRYAINATAGTCTTTITTNEFAHIHCTFNKGGATT